MTGKMNKWKRKTSQTVSDRLRSADRAEKRDDARRRSRRLGLWLIGAGGAGLLLILLFLGLSLHTSSIPESVSPWDFSDVKPLAELKAVPSAHGWSALDSFYASHPEVEGEEEYYLDPALWREPKRKAEGDTLAAAPAVARRTGLWNGPADGMLSVDTSIRPLQEQLKRQDAMQLQVVSPDSLSVAGAADTNGTYAGGYDIGMTGAEGASSATASADAPTSEKPLHVEFWESPVHYKGYQLSGNNLILYGINDSDSLRFENHTDGVWMYHKEAVYRLTTSAEMQRFELISGTDSLGEPAADEVEGADANKQDDGR